MVLIGLDDTDNVFSGGTGRLARALADTLRGRYTVLGVTRHQLLVDQRIPYTKKNSCNVVHLDTDAPDLAQLVEEAAAFVSDGSLEGSDPGVCVADAGRVHTSEFGCAAQTTVIEVADAICTAEELGCVLLELGGTGIGIIGALAGVVLASGGNDGRYVDVGQVRELVGTVTVQEILDSGAAEVRSTEGMTVSHGEVDSTRGIRPSLLEHRPVVVVKRHGRRLVAVRDDEVDNPHAGSGNQEAVV